DALDARQSEFCGEDTTAGVDMRKLRFPSCPGWRGALAYCFSPSRSPSTRWDRPRKPGTRRDDRRRYAALDNASRDGEGEPRTRGLAFEDRWGHRAPSFSTPADGAAVAADDASRSAVLQEDAPRPSARNVPPASGSSEPMSTALESGVSAAVASRRGGW